MAEIQAKALRAGLAHHARQDNRRRKEIQIAQFVRVACILENAGAWAALHVAAFGMKRKGGRA